MSRVTLLLLFMAASWLPMQASAEADGPDWWTVTGVAAEDVLNLRADGSPHAEKVGEIPPAARCVKNLGCKGGLTLHEYRSLSEPERKALARKRPRWCKVEYRSTTGWVAGHYLREGNCDAQYAD